MWNSGVPRGKDVDYDKGTTALDAERCWKGIAWDMEQVSLSRVLER